MCKARCLAMLVALLSCLVLQTTDARDHGRAFPIISENFAIESFQRTNPSIRWDPTNFLVDLSGRHAHCEVLHHRAGVKTIRHKTPAGETIVGAVDFIEGKLRDKRSINGYIQQVLKRWENTNQFHAQIRAARHVGCSVKPGCSGQVVVACLFSPGGSDDFEKDPPDPPEPIVGDQKALAFTPEQYSVAEQIMGRKWDRSYYLENLSGFETNCAMMGASDWAFPYVAHIMKELDLRIIGQTGYAANLGSTPDALRIILAKFKNPSFLRIVYRPRGGGGMQVANVREVGCSIIPDCINRLDHTMYVVIACLYEEL